MKIINETATKDVLGILKNGLESSLFCGLYGLARPEKGLPGYSETDVSSLFERFMKASWKEVEPTAEALHFCPDCREFVTSDIPGGRHNVVYVRDLPDDALLLVETIGVDRDVCELMPDARFDSQQVVSKLENRRHIRTEKKKFVLTVPDGPYADVKEATLDYYHFDEPEEGPADSISVRPGTPSLPETVTSVYCDTREVRDLEDLSVITRQQALDAGFETALVSSRAAHLIRFYSENSRRKPWPAHTDPCRGIFGFVSLRGRTLRGMDFRNYQLEDIDLQESYLHGTCFRHSWLKNVKLNGAFCEDCDFTSAGFGNVDAMGTDFGGASFDDARFRSCVFSGANFRGVFLRSAEFSDAVLEGADMSGAVLSKAVFKSSSLYRTNLRDSVLAGADLSCADLRGADLAGADLRGAVLTGADLTGADLAGAILSGADLTGADLECVRFDGASLVGTKLYRACGLYASFENAVMDGADMREAELDDCSMDKARLRGADLCGAAMNSAKMKMADLSGAKFADAQLEGAVMTGAVFTKADLSGADLSGADLTRAQLSGAILTGTDLTGAVLEEAVLSHAFMEKTKIKGTCFKNALMYKTYLYHVDLQGADTGGAFVECVVEPVPDEGRPVAKGNSEQPDAGNGVFPSGAEE